MSTTDKKLLAEVEHYRTACASVGETDGHGWAETTKELRAKLAALTLHWSDTKPTETGYWWLKDGTARIIVYVDIGLFDSFHHERVEFFGHCKSVNLRDVHGQWAGPLNPPEEP